MIIYGLDPGTEQSALVAYDAATRLIAHHIIATNDAILALCLTTYDRALIVEKIESYGMAVGAETFQTVWWAGRFRQAWMGEAYQLSRRDVKLHLCHSARATDANIRQALIDRFGGSAAIGKKATPGPLYGLKGHEFAALAVAVTWADTHPED